MRFFGDAKKSAPIVLTIFDVETLPFDLELFRFDNVVHFETRSLKGYRAGVEGNSPERE